MKSSERTRQLLIKHYQTYPQLNIQDLFKFLHQSAFGCEHLVTSPQAAAESIRREFSSCRADAPHKTESLDGNCSRVYLGWLYSGLSAETLGKLFFLSAREESGGISALEEKLSETEKLICEGILPFNPEEFRHAKEEWRQQEYSALHHSETFRSVYRPAYRVIANRYLPFLPLLARLDAMLLKGPVKLAIEGGSASGKTTLGALLEALYDSTVFHMDDFFLRPEQRTKERLAEPGGNADRERFLSEVLIPLHKGEEILYRRFDCSSMKLLPPVRKKAEKLTVIEGAYSMHPELESYYDLSVFLDVSPTLQKARILKRNSPQTAVLFFERWIPLEKLYFETLRVKERCSLSIPICESINQEVL